MLKVFASLIVCVILVERQTALANDMYRCGNSLPRYAMQKRRQQAY